MQVKEVYDKHDKLVKDLFNTSHIIHRMNFYQPDMVNAGSLPPKPPRDHPAPGGLLACVQARLLVKLTH